jgi:hypothetical protein
LSLYLNKERRGRALMKALTDTPHITVKREVEDMTAEEAAEIWGNIKDFESMVAVRASLSKVGMKWIMLLRKMHWIKAKAEARTEA